MDKLTGRQIIRMMRANRVTIRAAAAQWGLTQERVRYVRAHGVTGECFVRDWLQICGYAA